MVVNHFKSKGSGCAGVAPGTNQFPDPTLPDGQENCNLTRVSIAQALIDWLASDPTGSGDTDYLIIGDLNAYAREHPIRGSPMPRSILRTRQQATRASRRTRTPRT